MRFEGRDIVVRVGGRELARGIDLALEPGRRLVVHGPSGSGKTRLLRRLAHLDPWDGGALTLDGRTPAQWGAASWRAEVTLVLQGAPELEGTPADWNRAVAALAAQRERVADDPLDLAESWGLPNAAFARRWTELSVGERQRCQLAIALSRRPSVLLLDEPTSALDPDAEAAFERSMDSRAAVWVTHSRDQAARVADEVLELRP